MNAETTVMAAAESQELTDTTLEDIDFRARLMGIEERQGVILDKYVVSFDLPGASGSITALLFKQHADKKNPAVWHAWSNEPYGSDRERSFQTAECGLRWLFLCATYYWLRADYEVSVFLSAIERLAQDKEPFFSLHTYNTACRFTPEQVNAWQVYTSSDGPRFRQAFVGSESAARKFLEERLDDPRPKNLILIDPKTVMRRVLRFDGV